MKVLQINTVHKEKSTGRTCEEVNNALSSYGYEGHVAYGRGSHSDINSYRIGTELEYYFHNLMARITGLQGYYSFFATKRLIKYIKNLSPDIIHLRNLHAYYLNFPVLFEYLNKSNIPVVINLHDCWALTGKCTHNTDIKCEKWKTNCYSCPLVHSYPKSYFLDQTPKQYKDKKKWFQNLNDLTVIGVSKWMTEQAKMSYLSNKKCLTIYNWINQEVFYPRKENIFKKYNIDEEKFTIIGVSTSWEIGSPRYEDFLKISKLIPDNMQIVMIGNASNIKFPDNVRHINFINNVEELAMFYSQSDVYVHLSTEDSFGKVVAEAMACGTPVIVNDSTALPELVEDNCGYVCSPRNINMILNAIKKIEFNGSSSYSSSCINTVLKNFNYEKNASELIELYENTIKGNK